MSPPPFPHACRMCGASCYRPVIQRDSRGAMRPSGMFRCSGCSFVFSSPKDWRMGDRGGLLAAPLSEMPYASREGTSASLAAGCMGVRPGAEGLAPAAGALPD